VIPNLVQDGETKTKKPFYGKRKPKKTEISEETKKKEDIQIDKKEELGEEENDDELEVEDEVVENWEEMLESGKQIELSKEAQSVLNKISAADASIAREHPKAITAIKADQSSSEEESSGDESEASEAESSVPTISKETKEELFAKIRLRLNVYFLFNYGI
jgi:hypothetical protein